MIRNRASLFGLLLGGALLLGTASARADGLAIASSELSPEAKKTLVKDVAAFKAAHPEKFEAVHNIQGIKPEVYKTYRNPIPIATIELRHLGADALLPMLSALALDAPNVMLSDKEKAAYIIGLLEASSEINDARSGPVYTAVFESKGKSAPVLRAAAEAMGRVCGDAELASLKKHTAAGDPLRVQAIQGLGECRRKESAEHLASLLASATDSASAEPIVDALGIVASSWAWKAKGAKFAATAKDIQSLAAKTLVRAFVKYPAARKSAKRALRMVESPNVTALISSARSSADADAKIALDTLAKHLAPRKP